jgi:Arf-GAP/coiled-coil/ANK repeat/PH domain-containing protein
MFSAQTLFGMNKRVAPFLTNSVMLESTPTYFYPSFICRNIREAWIKAKYVERRFVQHLSILPALNEQSASPDHRSSRQLSVRKWSVRKLRRRPRSRDSRGEKKSHSAKRLPIVCETKNASANSVVKPKVSEENSKDTRTECGGVTQTAKSENAVTDEANDTLSVGSKASDSGTSSTQHELVNTDVLLFGETFEKQPLEGSIELSSDQDSTGGEEDEVIGNYVTKHVFLCVMFVSCVIVFRSRSRCHPGSLNPFSILF